MKKRALVVAAPLAAIPSLAAAQVAGPDYTTLTSAVDFTSTSTAIQAVGALAIGVTLVVLGIRKVMSMVRGA